MRVQLRTHTSTRVIILTLVILLIAKFPQRAQQTRLLLNDLEYFELPGLNVMAFQDIYQVSATFKMAFESQRMEICDSTRRPANGSQCQNRTSAPSAKNEMKSL